VAFHTACFSRLRQLATKAVKAAPGSSPVQPGSSFHSAGCKGFSAGFGGSTTGQAGQAAQACGAGQDAEVGAEVGVGDTAIDAQPARASTASRAGRERNMNLIKCLACKSPQA
jgi:hypothetical protein